MSLNINVSAGALLAGSAIQTMVSERRKRGTCGLELTEHTEHHPTRRALAKRWRACEWPAFA
jgi:hypothetical protein